jgi:hypothetical protein
MVNVIGEETLKESPTDRAYNRWVGLEERMKVRKDPICKTL